MKALFIGNGFDLNLGWPTSYTAYLESPFFNTFRRECKYSLDAPTNLAEHLKSLQDKNSWVDIELQLSEYSMNRAGANFLVDYNRLRESLCDYILSLNESCVIDQTSKAYKVIYDIYNLQEEIVIVNFNYTNSVHKLLGCVHENKFGSSARSNSLSVYHVHGSALNKDIIFGVDDMHPVRAGHIEIKKSTFNDVGGKLIKDVLKKARELYFFGLSLGETDHMYFRDFFGSLTSAEINKNITFYFYQKAGRLSLHEQFQSLTDNKVSLMKSNAQFKFEDVSIL